MVALAMLAGALMFLSPSAEAAVTTTAAVDPGTTAVATVSPTMPSGIVGYVAIHIANHRSTATGRDFSQQVIVKSRHFAAWEDSRLRNIEFFDSRGVVIPSWLESGASNRSTHTVYWLNLSAGVPAHGSVTVYMGFGNLTAQLINGRSTGESPTLSVHYGTRDNGRRVFTRYDDFNTHGVAKFGVSPAGWYNSGGSGPCSYVAEDNGLGLDAVNGCGVVYTGSDIPVSSAVAVDEQLTNYNAVSTDWQAPFVNSANATSYSAQGDMVRWSDQNSGCNSFNHGAYLQVVDTANSTIVANTSATPPLVLTVTDTSVLVNYTSVMTGSAFLGTSGYLAASAYTSTACGSDLTFHWIRTRAAPPGGVMPTANVGTTVL